MKRFNAAASFQPEPTSTMIATITLISLTPLAFAAAIIIGGALIGRLLHH